MWLLTKYPTIILTIVHIALVLVCGLHILLRRHRQPESRVAWLAVLAAVPYLGAFAYLLLGSTNIGKARIARLKDCTRLLPKPDVAPGWDASNCHPGPRDGYGALFHVGQSISDYAPVGGNRAELMADSDAMIASLVHDIDNAHDTVHLLFYIWLGDHNGTRVAEALERAARRGVQCRAIVDDIGALLAQPLSAVEPGFTAQVIATGPTYRNAAMAEMFETLMYAARRELFITTPYYVPTVGVQAALCAAGHRGIDTTIIFPARNDDFAVSAASRSHYESLLEAGVKIFEYGKGLLHTKSLTLDGEITLIGSANMDRRSFDLNFENNILLHEQATTAALRARQESYLADSRQISAREVADWGMGRRLRDNALAIVGPVL